ncbi:MAG: phosphatase PAP2 family protein [Candidatus Pacearchaeota archaeon]|jgi:undecaprenyl-diphosphatase
MKKTGFILSIFTAGIVTLIVYLNDTAIVQFVESLRNNYLDYFLLSISFASNTFIIFFFLTSLFLWKEHKRRWIVPLWLAVFVSGVISFILKILIHRLRPFHAEVVSVLQISFYFIKDNFNTWNFSMPSFHAMLIFAAIPLLSKEFKKFRYIWIIFAIIVCFSKVYFGVHYLSDVMVGAILGYLIGHLMVALEEKYQVGLALMNVLGVQE